MPSVLTRFPRATRPPASSSSTSTATTTSTSTSKLMPKSSKSLRLSVPVPVPPRPIVNSYWATPTLLACEYPHSPGVLKSKVDSLLTAGIRTFIDLTEPNELIPYSRELRQRASKLGLPHSDIDSIEYYRFAIPDRSIPPSPALLAGVLSVLEDCQRRGRKAAIHCRGGVGRTGTIVGCWLVQSGVVENGRQALEVIEREWCQVEKSKRFPRSPETGKQEDYVRRFRRFMHPEMSNPNLLSSSAQPISL